MSEIPANEVTQADLHAWYEMQKQLSALKSAEFLLRNKIFKGMFKDPREGTNTVPLQDGWVLKGKHTLNRSIDRAALSAMQEMFIKEGIATDQLVEYKPELKIGVYRTLTAEQQNLFDRALVVKEGAPALEIVLPKKNTAK